MNEFDDAFVELDIARVTVEANTICLAVADKLQVLEEMLNAVVLIAILAHVE